jgi:hypothetical protein
VEEEGDEEEVSVGEVYLALVASRGRANGSAEMLTANCDDVHRAVVEDEVMLEHPTDWDAIAEDIQEQTVEEDLQRAEGLNGAAEGERAAIGTALGLPPMRDDTTAEPVAFVSATETSTTMSTSSEALRAGSPEITPMLEHAKTEDVQSRNDRAKCESVKDALDSTMGSSESPEPPGASLLAERSVKLEIHPGGGPRERRRSLRRPVLPGTSSSPTRDQPAEPPILLFRLACPSDQVLPVDISIFAVHPAEHECVYPPGVYLEQRKEEAVELPGPNGAADEVYAAKIVEVQPSNVGRVAVKKEARGGSAIGSSGTGTGTGTGTGDVTVLGTGGSGREPTIPLLQPASTAR